MRFIKRIFMLLFGLNETELLCIRIRKPLSSVLTTMVYLNREDDITIDEIVDEALCEYFNNRMYAISEEKDNYGQEQIRVYETETKVSRGVPTVVKTNGIHQKRRTP